MGDLARYKICEDQIRVEPFFNDKACSFRISSVVDGVQASHVYVAPTDQAKYCMIRNMWIKDLMHLIERCNYKEPEWFSPAKRMMRPISCQANNLERWIQYNSKLVNFGQHYGFGSWAKNQM